MRMKGLFGTYDMESGQEINEENTETKWLASFKSPFFLNKTPFQFELMEENVERKEIVLSWTGTRQ